MRARPQRITIEHGGRLGEQPRRVEIDPANMPPGVAGAMSRLLDETRSPAAPDAPSPDEATYDVVLDYGERKERLRYSEAELSDDVRTALDSLLRPGS